MSGLDTNSAPEFLRSAAQARCRHTLMGDGKRERKKRKREKSELRGANVLDQFSLRGLLEQLRLDHLTSRSSRLGDQRSNFSHRSFISTVLFHDGSQDDFCGRGRKGSLARRAEEGWVPFVGIYFYFHCREVKEKEKGRSSVERRRCRSSPFPWALSSHNHAKEGKKGIR